MQPEALKGRKTPHEIHVGPGPALCNGTATPDPFGRRRAGRR
jgi:hypothetical protein